MAYKGQLSADFYVALVAFLGVVAYIGFQLFQIVPASSKNLNEESVRIEAYQISELLVNDGGEPSDWFDATKYPTAADIKRIGLSDSKGMTNLLSPQKITRFKSLCINFNDIKTLLDVGDDASFTIIEHRPTGDVTDACKPTAPSSKGTSFSISRTVFISGTSYPTEIIVEVWRR